MQVIINNGKDNCFSSVITLHSLKSGFVVIKLRSLDNIESSKFKIVRYGNVFFTFGMNKLF